jgi:hypothetical protein
MLGLYAAVLLLMATLGPALVLGWPRAPTWRGVCVALIVPGVLLGVVSVVGLAAR